MTNTNQNNLKDISDKYIDYANCIYSYSRTDFQFGVDNTIKQVVVILSPPRGGSSLLYEIMAKTGLFLLLDGEQTPYYKLGKATYPYNNIFSDEIKNGDLHNIDVKKIKDRIFDDLRVLAFADDFDVEKYFPFVIRKLSVQWPSFQLSYDKWKEIVKAAYRRLKMAYGYWNTDLFYLEIVKVLREIGLPVNPRYYDLPKLFIEEFSSQSLLGPPDPWFCIEEPPFVKVRPCSPPTKNELKLKPLLLKTSIDIYRLSLIHELFFDAEIKYIYLTRNPASSINGLYDGWLDRGFFSHNVSNHASLQIEGYSDMFDWGGQWWKFDLPPDWKKHTREPLLDVCKFQWKAAHNKVNEIQEMIFSSDNNTNVIRIKFEHLVNSLETRHAVLQEIYRFIKIGQKENWIRGINQLPVVMSTFEPLRARWLLRKSVIWAAITNDFDLITITERLGYKFSEVEKWI